jgi:hypothetical protein
MQRCQDVAAPACSAKDSTEIDTGEEYPHDLVRPALASPPDCLTILRHANVASVLPPGGPMLPTLSCAPCQVCQVFQVCQVENGTCAQRHPQENPNGENQAIAEALYF